MLKKKYLQPFAFCLLALVLFVSPCLSTVNNSRYFNDKTTETRKTTLEVSAQEINYESILTEFDNSITEKEGSLITFTGYKSINISDFDELDLLSESNVSENNEIKVKYDFSYDSETNIVTLSAELNDAMGEIYIDTIQGAAFINDNGEIDAVMNVDGEGILLSEMRDAGMIDNCGWFSNLIKKVVKVVAVAVVTAVAVAAVTAVVVATAGAAAPAVVAAGVGVVSSGVTAATVAGTAIAAGATAAAITAGVGTAIAIGETIADEVAESSTSSLVNDDICMAGTEEIDQLTKDLIAKIAKIATITTLREFSRVYHVAFCVSTAFSESDKNYSVGDLYISNLALTFDEAYLVLIESGIINSINDITASAGIIADVAKTVITTDMQKLIDLIKGYKSRGYFANKRSGIYADSVEAAATLAVVTGAWIKDPEIGIVGRGSVNGYNHLHNFSRTIHIWYGSKI